MVHIDEQKKEITEAVGARIRYYRRVRSLSQEELALRANINPAYYGQVERGLKCPTVDTLYKISLALGVPLFELVRFESSTINYEKDGVNLNRLRGIVARIPADKAERAFQLIDSLVDLL